MMNKFRDNQLRWLGLSVIIFLLDLFSKWLIQINFSVEQERYILPFFNLTLRYNTGAAFSFLGDAEGWQRWLFILIALIISAIILYTLAQLKRHENWIACGLAFILGGALGNVYDRIVYGYVTDFIDLHTRTWHFATFNLADSAINIGVAIWLIGLYKKSRESSHHFH